MAGIKEQVYKVAPIPIQHLLVTMYGWHWKRLRFGGNYKNEYQGFLQREWYTKAQWNDYVETQLRQLLKVAFQSVPYYQKAWKGIVTLDQLEKFTVADMPSLPTVEKRHVRDDPQSFLVGGKPPQNSLIHHTSGSSGTPITTYWTPLEMQRSLAMRESRSCRFAGVSYSIPRATFSGRMIEPNPNSKGPYYRFNFLERQVYFSAFHLRPDTAQQYLNALMYHQIQWITGYSNSIYQLARMALDYQLQRPQIKSVITTSEKLTPEMRRVIEEAFSTQVYEEYGIVEELFYVCENEYGQKLVNPDCGLLEVVDSHFQPVDTGNEGEVLATGFLRPTQPMIRYRLGDMAVYSDEKPKCGREMLVLSEVVGRLEDTIYGVDGRRMVRFHGIFVNQPHIREGQIIQERLNHLRVLIVPSDAFGQMDVADITTRIQQRLTSQMQVTIELVDRIERTPAGKFKAVISHLSAEDLKQIGHNLS